MNYPNDRSIVNATALTVTIAAFIFASFISVLLLKYILYENGSFYRNIFLLASICCTRYFMLVTKKSLRAQEIACLFLFVLYDKHLLDFFNVFLLLGVECIREQLRQSTPLKELVSLVIGLIFLLMGWFSVGRVLVMYNFSIILFVTLAQIIALIKIVIYYLYFS